MAGEYGKGILYLLTCGGFGVFYVFDVLNILSDNYSISQVNYTEELDGRIVRRKLRIYLDKVQMAIIRKGLLIGGAVLIGVCSMKFGYTRFLVWADKRIEVAANAYVTDYGHGTDVLNWEGLIPDVTEETGDR